MRVYLRTMLVAAMAVPLMACALTGMGGGSAPTTYDLNATPAPGKYGTIRGRLAVREPRALQLLDSERIVYRPTPVLVTYYSGAQWSDRLPKLFEARLVEAFGSVGRVSTVTRSVDGLNVDYQLLSEIRQFEVVNQNGRDIARISIFVQIVLDTRSRALAGRLFEAELPIEGGGAKAGISALNSGLSMILTDVVRWTLQKI